MSDEDRSLLLDKMIEKLCKLQNDIISRLIDNHTCTHKEAYSHGVCKACKGCLPRKYTKP